MSVWVGGCGMHVRAPTCQVNDVMLSQVLSSVQFGFLGLKPNFGAPVKSFVTLGVLAGTLGTASAQGGCSKTVCLSVGRACLKSSVQGS